jgi:hypothetical protein
MTPRRSDDADLPATIPPSITFASGREVSKASLFYVLQAGGWGAVYTACSLAAVQKFGLWPTLLDKASSRLSRSRWTRQARRHFSLQMARTRRN